MAAIPICCVTGRIAGDSDACGDCDPCSAYDRVPSAVKQLLKERDEWRDKYSEAAMELDACLARNASATADSPSSGINHKSSPVSSASVEPLEIGDKR